jgi:hypothetical protein
MKSIYNQHKISPTISSVPYTIPYIRNVDGIAKVSITAAEYNRLTGSNRNTKISITADEYSKLIESNRKNYNKINKVAQNIKNVMNNNTNTNTNLAESNYKYINNKSIMELPYNIQTKKIYYQTTFKKNKYKKKILFFIIIILVIGLLIFFLHKK